MQRLEECIKKKFLSTSRSREVIYEILKNNTHRCLSVKEIVLIANEIYPKKISLNTIYRHLKLFLECNLICEVKNGEKKAYYCYLEKSEIPVFEICCDCKRILKSKKKLDIEKVQYIIIYLSCEECKKPNKKKFSN